MKTNELHFLNKNTRSNHQANPSFSACPLSLLLSVYALEGEHALSWKQTIITLVTVRQTAGSERRKKQDPLAVLIRGVLTYIPVNSNDVLVFPGRILHPQCFCIKFGSFVF